MYLIIVGQQRKNGILLQSRSGPHKLTERRRIYRARETFDGIRARPHDFPPCQAHPLSSILRSNLRRSNLVVDIDR